MSNKTLDIDQRRDRGTHQVPQWVFQRRPNEMVHHRKKAFAVYKTLEKLDDLLGGIAFAIKTEHRNLLYMNNHGSRKVLQWKLDIQHYNATIEHVP